MTSLLNRIRARVAGEAAPDPDPLVTDLQAALAPARVANDSAARSLLSHDASVFEGGNAGPICYPLTTDEVAHIMGIAERHTGGRHHVNLVDTIVSIEAVHHVHAWSVTQERKWSPSTPASPKI